MIVICQLRINRVRPVFELCVYFTCMICLRTALSVLILAFFNALTLAPTHVTNTNLALLLNSSPVVIRTNPKARSSSGRTKLKNYLGKNGIVPVQNFVGFFSHFEQNFVIYIAHNFRNIIKVNEVNIFKKWNKVKNKSRKIA